MKILNEYGHEYPATILKDFGNILHVETIDFNGDCLGLTMKRNKDGNFVVTKTVGGWNEKKTKKIIYTLIF